MGVLHRERKQKQTIGSGRENRSPERPERCGINGCIFEVRRFWRDREKAAPS